VVAALVVLVIIVFILVLIVYLCHKMFGMDTSPANKADSESPKMSPEFSRKCEAEHCV